MKRKRHIEITRYRSGITVIHGDAPADLAAAEETAADLGLKMSDDATFARAEINGKEPVSEAAAEMPSMALPQILRFAEAAKVISRAADSTLESAFD